MEFSAISPPLEEISAELQAEREALRAALIARSLIRAEQKPTLTSMRGRKNRWLVDTRVLLLDPVKMRRIAWLFLDSTKTMGDFQLACLEMTGIPLMLGIQHTALAEGRAINGLLIRKEPKKNGRMRSIEGTPNDLPVVFVDDLLNSASSFAHGICCPAPWRPTYGKPAGESKACDDACRSIAETARFTACGRASLVCCEQSASCSRPG